MMREDGPTAEEVDPAIPLENGETVAWLGQPRKTVILPAVVTGLLVAAAGVIGFQIADTPLLLALVPLGLAIVVWQHLVNEHTQYVVTDRAVYVKRGVLTRSVTQAVVGTVQNSSYAQDITGSLFGYGSVELEIAGGRDIVFRAVDQPQEVRALLDRAVGSNDDGVTRDSSTPTGIPGSLEQWQQVRDEVRAVRRAIKEQQ